MLGGRDRCDRPSRGPASGEGRGPAAPAHLRRPHSDKLKDARIDLRELRVNAPNATIRILYAFDPIRQAVLLVGGDKRGDKRFYKRMIPLAERLFAEYLLEVK